MDMEHCTSLNKLNLGLNCIDEKIKVFCDCEQFQIKFYIKTHNGNNKIAIPGFDVSNKKRSNH